MARPYESPLRKRQTDDTRRRIVEAALQLIAEQPGEQLSHEEIATRAAINVRTVYRHFATRPELLDAVWHASDSRLQLTNYPDTEETMLSSIPTVFGQMDTNEPVIRGLLNSNAGQQMRRRDNDRRRRCITAAVADATRHLPPAQRARVTAVFISLYSARTWEMMRDRAGLPAGEAAPALQWAMRTLLGALHAEQRAHARSETNGNMKRPSAAKRTPSRKR